jgi:hypothetical protein
LGILIGGERRRGHVRNAYACGHKTEFSQTIDYQVLGESWSTVVFVAKGASSETCREKACSQTRFRCAQGSLDGGYSPSRIWSSS